MSSSFPNLDLNEVHIGCKKNEMCLVLMLPQMSERFADEKKARHYLGHPIKVVAVGKGLNTTRAEEGV